MLSIFDISISTLNTLPAPPWVLQQQQQNPVSLPYKQRAFIICDQYNDFTLKICFSASSAFTVTVRNWLGSADLVRAKFRPVMVKV